ncbi:XkdW family protein [Neobacillus drentensis]|uniref:XkdW family protein n=1 Tax=Neobacillus drentensis TaxID=220684 RepID=UPI003000C41A
MNISEAIQKLFPNAKPGSDKDFLVMDLADGEGQFIAEWNLPDPQPTETELQAAWKEYQLNPPPAPLSEFEKLQQLQELMQQAIDEIIFGGDL